MAITISTNTVITGTTHFDDDVEIAAGVTVTVAAGGVLDIGAHALVNAGTLVLAGTEASLATFRAGAYDADGTSGTLQSNYGWLSSVDVWDGTGNATMSLSHTVVENSDIEALAHTSIQDCIFVETPFDVGTRTDVTVARTTFKDSFVMSQGNPAAGTSHASFTQCNFVTDMALAIEMDPTTAGAHPVTFTNCFMYLPLGSSFEDHVYDVNDNPAAGTDLTPAMFGSPAYVTGPGQVSVGPYVLDLTIYGVGTGTVKTGTAGNDLLIGTASDDTMSGLAGDDGFNPDSGNDAIDGGTGIDTVFYGANASNFSILRVGGNVYVTDKIGPEGTDSLVNVERLTFTDKTVNLSIHDAVAGVPLSTLHTIEELYVAFFNRVPDADGLAYWVGQMQAGMSIAKMSDLFYSAGVQYSALTGYSANMTNADFVNVVYKNVLGRADGADAEGLAFWSNELATGHATRGTLVSSILGSAHTFKGNATWGWVADLLDNKVAVANTFAVDYGLNYNTPEASISEGMKIAHAVTPTDTSAAIALMGVPELHLG